MRHRAPLRFSLMALFASSVLVSCEKPKGSPDWPSSTNQQESFAPATGSEYPDPIGDPTKSTSIRLMVYNVENWLAMERGTREPAPKPESEKQAIIRLVSDKKPNVLGLCEIGTEADLREIQNRLNQAGTSMPYLRLGSGSDSKRRLGLLSTYPIIATGLAKKTSFRIHGKRFLINRGILDATINANGNPVRLLGVHLKSKRDAEGEDQELIRQNEAHLLRLHIDSILHSKPDTKLIVYGDLNDSPASPTVKTITGSNLAILPLHDSNQETWTYFWKPHEQYSRIDFILASPSMKGAFLPAESRIIDDPLWKQGSDHRPLLGVFRLSEMQ